MPSELIHPFALGPGGALAVTADPDRQIGQHVRTLISTTPGERVILSDYGVPTQELLFAPDDELVAAGIALRAKEMLAKYEPGVVLQRVVPIPNADSSGIAEVALDYVRRESSTSSSSLSRNTNTAIITVGGHVSEVIRG